MVVQVLSYGIMTNVATVLCYTGFSPQIFKLLYIMSVVDVLINVLLFRQNCDIYLTACYTSHYYIHCCECSIFPGWVLGVDFQQ